ncbi:MAG: FxLYD domain-containing protein [bacterium]|nr:FxLYD domain-containing protein [bacterium]
MRDFYYFDILVTSVALYRFTKQLVIGSMFLMVVIGVALWIWFATQPKPSCFDGMHNQDEQAVDCGGICTLACKKEPLYPSLIAVTSTHFLVGTSAYDLLGQVENENTDFGAVSFGYRFSLLDASGTVIVSREGMSYALPGERKYLVERRLQSAQIPHRAALELFDESWMEVTEFPGISLIIRDRSYGPVASSDAESTARAAGVIVNRTGYDFQQVDIVVLLRNEAGNIVGAGSTDVRVLNDGTQRAFEIRWPLSQSVSVERVDMEAYTNLLANENFLIRYGKKAGTDFSDARVPAALR